MAGGATAANLASVKSTLAEVARDVAALPKGRADALDPILREALAEVDHDLGEWLRKQPGSTKFTAQKYRQVILQLRTALAETEKRTSGKMREVLTHSTREAGEMSLEHLEQQVASLVDRYGSSVIPLQLKPAAIIAKGDRLIIPRIKNSSIRYGKTITNDIRRMLATGLVRGETFDEMTSRLVKHGGPRGRVFTRGPHAKFPVLEYIPEGLFVKYRHFAERVVRTETMAAYNDVHHEGMVAANKKDPGYRQEWNATFATDRTCEICGRLHGQVAKLGKNFPGGYWRPPAHPNCYCTILPWREEWGGQTEGHEEDGRVEPTKPTKPPRPEPTAAEARAPTPPPKPKPAAPVKEEAVDERYHEAKRAHAEAKKQFNADNRAAKEAEARARIAEKVAIRDGKPIERDLAKERAERLRMNQNFAKLEAAGAALREAEVARIAERKREGAVKMGRATVDAKALHGDLLEAAKGYGAEAKAAGKKVREHTRNLVEATTGARMIEGDIPRTSYQVFDNDVLGGASAVNDSGQVKMTDKYHDRFVAFTKAVAAGEAPTVDSAKGMHTALHEEVHSMGPFRRSSYERHGQVVEEVATEVLSRRVMREHYGDLEVVRDDGSKGKLGEEKMLQAGGWGSYQREINDVRGVILGATGTSPEEATRRLDEAALRFKRLPTDIDARTPDDAMALFVGQIEGAEDPEVRGHLMEALRALRLY